MLIRDHHEQATKPSAEEDRLIDMDLITDTRRCVLEILKHRPEREIQRRAVAVTGSAVVKPECRNTFAGEKPR